MAQVRGLGPGVVGRPVLFCIQRVNVQRALVVTSWTCYGAL